MKTTPELNSKTIFDVVKAARSPAHTDVCPYVPPVPGSRDINVYPDH